MWFADWWKWCEVFMACVLICGRNELCTLVAHFHTFWFRLAGSTDCCRTQYWNTAKITPLQTNMAESLPVCFRVDMAGTTTQLNANMAANAASQHWGTWSAPGWHDIFAHNDRSAILGRLRYRCTPLSSRCNFVSTVFLQTRGMFVKYYRTGAAEHLTFITTLYVDIYMS
jgi:hypothetical protein